MSNDNNLIDSQICQNLLMLIEPKFKATNEFKNYFTEMIMLKVCAMMRLKKQLPLKTVIM